MKTRVLVLMIWTSVWAFSSNSHAQQSTFSKVFKHTNGDIQGYSMVQSAESEYLIAGQMENMGVVLKTDSSGNFIWAKRYLLYGPLTRIIRTSDSLFVLLGMIGDQYDQLVCMKITGSGEIIWTKQLTFYQMVRPNGIIETSDHGFLLTCESFVVKLDPSGNLSWIIQPPDFNGFNAIHDAEQTPDGGYIVFGKYINSDFTSEASLLKLNPDGTVAWLKKLSIPGSQATTYNFDIEITNSGFYCFYYLQQDGDSKIMLVKTDLSGNVNWARKKTGNILFDGLFQSPTIHKTNDQGLAFAIPGEWNGELVRIDSLGNVRWSDVLLINVYDMIATADDGYMVLGNGPLNGVTPRSLLYPHIGVIKLDSTGAAASCAESDGMTMDTILVSDTSLVWYPFTATVYISDIPVTVFDELLNHYDGCVDVTPAIGEFNTEQHPVQLFPNPSGDLIRVEISGTFTPPVMMEILNTSGVTLRQFQLNSHSNTFDISDWPAGFYFYRLTGKSFQFNGKFIKR